MTVSPRPSTHNVGRFTGLVLGMVVCICIIMIGIAGYLKYELDRAENILAAPEAALNDQDIYNHLRRSLGYSGFVGLAQNYITTRDVAVLSDMKAQIKTADDIVAHFPEKLPPETRRDIQAITTLFDTALQKAEKSSTDAQATFTTADLAPLYTALPILDARITNAAASNRLTAQSQLQFWAMMLTLVSWASLIIAAAMSVGIYLSLRDRNSAPMRALAQSVKNMAHGDMRTSIWGMERSDMIGELARTIDQARYHFSQLPDMSLLSDKGPVRIRFEGNTKTMFEAMMQMIGRDSEQVRHQAVSLGDAVARQNQEIATLGNQVQTVLNNILQRGQTADQQVKHALHDMVGSVNALKHAQEHAADQLNRIVPFLQERAQGLSEITHITGKQVSHVLQNLILTEKGLKQSAEQSEIAIGKLSTTADDLGNRLFGAVNLLQASGKVLAETTETTQSRLNEAIEKLHLNVPQSLSHAALSEASDHVSNQTALHLESLITSLEAAHRKLEDIVSEQTQAARAQIDFLTTHSTSLLSQSTTTVQTLSSAAEHLREGQARFDTAIQDISTKLENIGGGFKQQTSSTISPAELTDDATQTLLKDISTRINDLSERIANLQSGMPTERSSSADENNLPVENLMVELKSGFETTVRSLAQVREQMTNMVINTQAQAPVIIRLDHHWQEVAAQIETTRSHLSQLITQQIERIENRLGDGGISSGTSISALPQDAQEQMEQQTQILTELVATLGVLDEHMQQIKEDIKRDSNKTYARS